HPDRPAAVAEQERQVLVGVPRRREGLQGQPAEVDFVTVVQPHVVEAAAAGGAGEDGGAVVGGELAGAGEEVGVQVGVRGVGDPQPAPVGGGPQRTQVAGRVHREGPPVAEVEQVGAVAQPVVDQRYQVVG